MVLGLRSGEREDIPPDISSMPDMIAEVMRGSLSDVQRSEVYPDMTEKNTTYAHTLSMTCTEDVTDEVKAVTGSDEVRDGAGGRRSYLYIALPASPIMRDESRSEAYRMMPIRVLPSMTLTVPQTNAEDGILQKLIICDSSAWLILFSEYSLSALFAPMGKPHKSPKSAAEAPSRDSPNIFDIGIASTERRRVSP